MKKISVQKFVEMLADYNGPMRLSMITSTQPEMLKKSRETGEPNPYLGRVEHIAKRPGILGVIYENAVNNRRLKEASDKGMQEVEYFTAESLWNGAGERVNRAIVRHKTSGQLYVVLMPDATDEGHAKNTEEVYRDVDNPSVTFNVKDLEPFLKGSGSAKRQELDRPVPWRLIKVENILEVTLGGQVYSLTGRAKKAILA